MVVPQARLERALLSEQDFESSASTIPPLGHIFIRANLSKWRLL